MDILKFVGASLVWISGVIAGLSATLYALGFAATVAHQRMLGVGWGVISREPLWYLGAGGQVLVGWLAQAMVVFFIVIVAGEATLRTIAWLKARNGRLTKYLGQLSQWIDRNIVWLFAFLAMLLTGFLHQSLAEPVAIRDLLLQDPQATCAANGLAAAVADFDETILSERASEIAFLSAMVIAVGAYAVPRLVTRTGPPLALLICLAAGINAVIAVPVSFGILQVDTRWHSVTGNGTIGAFPDGSLRLLGRTPDGVWAWDPIGRSVHLFTAGSFQQLKVGPARAIRTVLRCENRTTKPQLDQNGEGS